MKSNLTKPIFIKTLRKFLWICPCIILSIIARAQPSSMTYTSPGTFTFTIPAGYNGIAVKIETWGAGGGAGFGSSGNGGGGGSGGGYASTGIFYVDSRGGAISYTVIVGAGGSAATASANRGTTGGTSSVTGSPYTILATGGAGGLGNNFAPNTPGAAGTGTSTGPSPVTRTGGTGGNSQGDAGAGGGGGASSSANGTSGGNAPSGTPGTGGTVGGGSGGNGGGNGVNGTAPGGGGGGKGKNGSSSGNGGNGKVVISIITFLALQLTGFEVIIENNFPKLRWHTINEKYNKEFVIERSIDGKKFETIGTVLSQGNSMSVMDYEYFDKDPFHGNNFYKLMQKDQLGFVSPLTNVIQVFVHSDRHLNLYPNITNQAINIILDDDPTQPTIWKIISHDGSLSKTGVTFQKAFTIDINSLNQGKYFFIIRDKNLDLLCSPFVKL